MSGDATDPIDALHRHRGWLALLARLQVDGIYGQNTQTAVTNFQKANHIAADGIYGPVTATHLAWPISPGSPDFGSCELIPPS